MIPFLDLKVQYRQIKPEIDAAVMRVLEGGCFTQGRSVSGFEADFSDFCGSTHGVAVNSGTSALHLALLAAGVGAGDEVITVPLTFVATVSAICYTGAHPVFVDVDPHTLNIDVLQIEAAITPQTKVILPVHLHGQPADMDAILKIARRFNLIVIEDAAQAHGATYKGSRVGCLGDLACFSFYPGKNLGGYGEGGMVLTNRAEYVRSLRILRDCGQEVKHRHVRVGYNYRMTEMQAAILCVKLKYLVKWTKQRRRHADLYRDLLRGENLVIPAEINQMEHVFHIFAIQVEERDALQAYLVKQGIQTGIHYPTPVHLQEGFKFLGYNTGDFPVAESYGHRTLSLPLFPELNESQIEVVSEAVKDFFVERLMVEKQRTAIENTWV